MRIRFLLLCCSLSLLICPIANAEIYKTVDKNGRTVYTDLPPANTTATPVELPSINTVPPTQTDYNIGNTPTNIAPNPSYQITIISPVNGATLMPVERNLNVSVTVEPALYEQPLSYFIDGKVVQETFDTSITIVDPNRGEHTLVVKVMGKDGQVFGESNAVKLVVMRPIAKQNKAPVPVKK